MAIKTKPKAYILLHDIRSAYNIGSIFRTADAAGVSKIFLSGYSPVPVDRFNRARKDISKTALGAEKSVAWEYVEKIFARIKKLKKEGVLIVSVEQDAKSLDYKRLRLKGDTLFVFGNEVDGVDKKFLKLSDEICEIPMRGEKESLNVGVSAGIVLFRVLDK